MCLSVSVSPLSSVVCLCLPMTVLLFLWLPWSVFVCHCLFLSVFLFADNFTPPLSPILLSPRSLSRAQAHRRQRIGRPEESWCPWQTEGRPACFCGSRCRSFAAGTCVHASQPQKAPPQDRRIARVRGSAFRTGRTGADACPRTLCMGGNLRSISASSTSGGVPSCGVRGISFVSHDHSGAGPTMIAGCS